MSSSDLDIKCTDYTDKFENWFSEEYKSIDDFIVGISFYYMELDENYFGHEFNLITSKPKNFRINTISTSRNDLNAIEAYLLLVAQINSNEKFLKPELENFVDNAYNELNKDVSNFDLFFTQNSQQCILTVRAKKEDIVIDNVKNIITIVYIDSSNKKSFLVSISPIESLADYQAKNLLDKLFQIFISDKKQNRLIALKDKFLKSNTKQLSINFSNQSQLKTSIVLFSDITNSTKLINAFPREGLFIIRRLVGKLAETIEKHDLLVNEIPGDGILYSIGFGKFLNIIKSKSNNQAEESFLDSFLKNLYMAYTVEKQKIIKEVTTSCEYKNNPGFYKNFKELLNKAFLKTAICIDGIYFLPLDGISFKQSILYGTRLWNIPKAFMNFIDEKNRNDIILFHDNIEDYFKTFSITQTKSIKLDKREIEVKTYHDNIQESEGN